MSGWLRPSVFALCALYATGSCAAEPVGEAPKPAETRGSGFRSGAFRLYPTLGVSLGYESNIALTNQSQIDSFTTVISPSIRAETGSATNLITVTADADITWYEQSTKDNSADYGVRAEWFYNPLLRHAFGIDGSIRWSHDRRGTGAREGDLALLDRDPDRYRTDQIGGKYQFGAPGARGRLEFDASLTDRTYLNNRDFTASRDQQVTNFGGAFYFRVAPKTSALLRVEQSGINYDSATLDSTERHYFLGIELERTAKLSGSVMVGRVEKSFDDPTRQDFTGTSWRVGLKYKLKPYSSIDLTTDSETDETNGTGDFILRRDVALGWSHSWSDRVNTAVDGGFAREQYRPTIREDQTRFFGVSGSYAFRRWLRGGVSYRTYKRTSDVNQFDYNRDLLLFSIEASL